MDPVLAHDLLVELDHLAANLDLLAGQLVFLAEDLADGLAAFNLLDAGDVDFGLCGRFLANVGMALGHLLGGCLLGAADHHRIDEINDVEVAVEGLAVVVLHRHAFGDDDRVTNGNLELGRSRPDLLFAGIDLHIGVTGRVHCFNNVAALAGCRRLLLRLLLSLLLLGSFFRRFLGFVLASGNQRQGGQGGHGHDQCLFHQLPPCVVLKNQ